MGSYWSAEGKRGIVDGSGEGGLVEEGGKNVKRVTKREDWGIEGRMKDV